MMMTRILARPLRRLAKIGAFGVLVLGAADALAAQAVRGRVVLPDSSTPARGVLVTASDVRGAALGRVVTDGRGAFVLPLEGAERVILRALRVGYRPTVLPLLELVGGGEREVLIVLTTQAVQLTAVTVRRSDACRARDDSRARVADVWEEARKALLLSNTQRTGAGLVSEWAQFDRQLDSLGLRMLDQAVTLSRAPSDRPFRSRDADLLARDGYVIEEDGTIAYYAPDADVLLSDSFAATHCFQLEEPPERASRLIGLRFRPIAEARRRRDIEGVFWLDLESAELRSIEFAFTGLPAVASHADPGGRVEFTRLADGGWVVSRWQIRMPVLERVKAPVVSTMRVRVVGPAIRLRAVQVVGGEITQVEQGGAVIYRASGNSLLVRLVASPTDSVPLGGATVRLDGTDYRSETDATGVARFDHVLEGRYRISASSPAVESTRLQPMRDEITVRGDSLHAARLRLPRRPVAVPVAEAAAPSRARERTEVEFAVTDTMLRPVAGVELIAVDAMRREHRLRSDSLGRALLVGLPVGLMRVEARMPGYFLAVGNVDVTTGRTPAEVRLERFDGSTLEAVRVEAEADERFRYGAFEARRRSGAATASITSDEIHQRAVVNAWQMLLTVNAVSLIDGPEGVLPYSRRVTSMDLRAANTQPCYMRMAIDGVLLADLPVNLRDRMPPVPEIHGIEVFAGPASIPFEYAGDQRNTMCGLIVVWTR